MSVNTIEGVPAGWELVRIGAIYDDDWFVNRFGQPQICRSFELSWLDGPHMARNCVIIRCIKPPKPTYIPWTFHTCPLGIVVRRKEGKFRGEVSGAGASGANIANGFYNYVYLFENWEQLDGTPCGTVEVLN